LAVGLLKIAHYLGAASPVEVPQYEHRYVPDRTYRFLAAVDFFLELKSTFGDTPGNEEQVVDKYCKCTCLLIDDIGAEKVSDWSRQMFYTLIDRRYRDMKQTIITSNLSLGELARHIDTRITSRLLEMGIAIDLGKVDYRKKAFERKRNG
jgi:DNA replication protein DnaC